MNSQFAKITRILLGIMLLLSGLNKILKIIPTPADYIFPVVSALEVIIAVLLLSKKWVPFALVLLAPLSINILLFHFYLDFQGIVPAIIVAVLNGILIYKHWRQYLPLFT